MAARHSTRRIGVTLMGAVAFALGAVSGCATPAPRGAPDAQPPEPAETPRAAKSSLQEQLDEYHKSSQAAMTPAQWKALDEGVAALCAANAGAQALKLGAKAPNFTLLNTAAEPVELVNLEKSGPVVLLWYRGGWCPYCALTLRAYQDAAASFTELGATLVGISPQTLESSATTKELAQLDFDLLCDVGNRAARAYGLVYTAPALLLEGDRVQLDQYNGDSTNELPVTATYVIGTDGIIKYAFVHPDFRRRAEPAAVLDALRKLQAGR